jgi:ArsR family transcriptional regulator
VDIFKSLSDDNRLQIVLLLAKNGEMNVTEICTQLNQSQPAVSHHLTQLKKAHLVDSSRDGKFNFYTLDSSLLKKLIGIFYPSSGSAQQELLYGDLKILFKAK